MKLFLFALPLLLMSSLIWQDQPAYLHPVVYVSIALWAGCAWVTFKTAMSRGTVKRVPWQIVALAVLLAANAILAGNEYGRMKVLTWLATCLPFMLLPFFARIEPRHFTALAWGQLLAGFVVIPTIVTLDRQWWGPTSYIAVALFTGLAALSGLFLPRLQRPSMLKPMLMLLVAAGVLAAVAGLLLSGARGAIAAAILALAVIPFMQGMRAAVKLALVGAVLAGAILVLPGFWGAQLEVWDMRLGEENLGESLEIRFGAIIYALEAFLSSPWLGIGAGRFADMNEATRIVVYPHNLLLELGAEFGVVAMLLMAWILLGALRGLWRLRHSDRLAAAFGLVSFLFLLVNAMKMGDITSHRLLYLWVGIALAMQPGTLRSFTSLLFGSRAANLEPSPQK